MERIFPVSAAHGYGVRDFMNALTEDIPEEEQEEPGANDRIRVAVLGRPNVGKSSLINRILGLDRLIVSELPGTTRDPVDTPFEWKSRQYVLIDTAGLRRKSRVKEKIDTLSMIKTIRSLERCHIAVVLLDAEAGVAEQDARICGYALDKGRGLVLGVNKWDLIKKEPDHRRRLENEIDRQLNFISFAPRINLSALTGEKVKKLFDRIDSVYGQYSIRVGTGELNRVMERILSSNPPPRTGRERVRYYYATQVSVRPPTFIVFVSRPDKIHFSYRRYFINQLRAQFGFDQTPIRVYFRKREKTG
jgi:GTP-binding protein